MLTLRTGCRSGLDCQYATECCLAAKSAEEALVLSGICGSADTEAVRVDAVDWVGDIEVRE